MNIDIENMKANLLSLRFACELADQNVIAARSAAGIFGTKGIVYHAEGVRTRAYATYTRAIEDFVAAVAENKDTKK